MFADSHEPRWVAASRLNTGALAPWSWFAGGCVALMVCSSGCQDSDRSGEHDVACSTGPASPSTIDLPFSTHTATHECTPRCGAVRQAPDNTYDADALPSGACSADGDVCTLALREPCCGMRGALSTFSCRCSAGTWSCGVAVRGAAACICGGARIDASIPEVDGGGR